jgi:DNA-binding transcriptional LysR family regulator
VARPPTPLGLQAFRQTILSGSVTGAAAALGRTQPAISRLLKDLEADVGFALFDRVKGRLVATTEGRLFFEELQRSFLGFERISSVAAEIRQGRRGTLRVAALPSAAASFLPGALADFRRACPDTAVEFLIHSSVRVAQMVQAQECDLGIIEGFFAPPALSVLSRHTLRGAVLVPPGSALAGKRKVALRDLHAQPVVALSPARSSLGAQLNALMVREGIEPRITIHTNLTSAVSALVLQGMGIGVADEQTALMHIRHGGTARPLHAPIAMQLRFVRAVGLPPAGALRSFIAHCDAALVEKTLS